jgi:hypothetical protein
VKEKSLIKGAKFEPCLANSLSQFDLKKFQVLSIESARIAADLNPDNASLCLTIPGSKKSFNNLSMSHDCLVQAIPFNKLILSTVSFSF